MFVFISDNGGAEILCVKFCQLSIGSRYVVGGEVRVFMLTSDSGGTETLHEVLSIVKWKQVCGRWRGQGFSAHIGQRRY